LLKPFQSLLGRQQLILIPRESSPFDSHTDPKENPMSKSEPFDLDDDDDRPTRRPRRDEDEDRPRRRRSRRRRDDDEGITTAKVSMIGMFTLAGFSGLAGLLALEGPIAHAAAWAGLACCGGIYASMCQAEWHHQIRRRRAAR
jgi:hypothetical protein